MTIARSSIHRRLRWSAAPVALTLALAVGGCASSADSAGTGTATATASSSSSTTGSATGSGDVVSLAQAFAATLSQDQKASLQQNYTFANAANWSNLPDALLTGVAMGGAPGGGTGGPPAGAPTGDGARPPSGGTGGPAGGGGQSSTGRVGLQTDALSDAQWTALEALLKAATGTAQDEGFDEVLQHLAADDYLADNGGGDTYGRGDFFIAFLGTPSGSGTWELQFGGHHLAIANTYTDGKLAGATPSFRGIEPFTTVEVDGESVQPEQQEAAAFSALLTSLDKTQTTTATLSKDYNDLLLGPGKDWAFPTTPEGIKGSDLSEEQKKLLLAAIDTYVDDVDDTDAAAILATYQSQLDQTYLSFAGTTGVDQVGDYVRIDGPQVWIEFSMQHGIVLDGAHPHAVWRDKKSDYAGTTA